MNIIYYHPNNPNSPTPERIGEVLGLEKYWKGVFDLSLIPAEGVWVIRGYSDTTEEFFAMKSDDWRVKDSWKEIPVKGGEPGEMVFETPQNIDWSKSGRFLLQRV